MEYSVLITLKDIDKSNYLYPSYSSFKKNIALFDINNYIEYVGNSSTYNVFFNFMENYKDIENEDLKKPIFSQTTKFKKNVVSFNNYKYMKINRDKEKEKEKDKDKEKDKEKEKNNFIFKNPVNENDKISILIKSYLNKITADTYKKVSSDLINELLLFKNKNLFEILSSEIINKCLFDNKYRNLYINLCNKIWSNYQLHYNLINIILKDNKYYWQTINSDKLSEPFSSDIQAKNDAYQKINFKKFFINYIHKQYLLKDLSFNNLTDDEIFLKKKKIILLVELIGILYIEKYINFDIINLIIIDLLHLNNSNDSEDVEIECLYVLLKLIKESKLFNNGLLYKEYNKIFTEYINVINKLSDNSANQLNQSTQNNMLSKRIVFFLGDIISILKDDKSNSNISLKKSYSNNSINSSVNNYVNVVNIDKLKELIDENIKNENTKSIISTYKNSNEESKNLIINKLINFHLDNKKEKNSFLIKVFEEINDENILFKTLNKIIDNIEDIALDIPDVDKKILLFVNSIKISKISKDNIIKIIENKKLSNESDSNSESETDSDED